MLRKLVIGSGIIELMILGWISVYHRNKWFNALGGHYQIIEIQIQNGEIWETTLWCWIWIIDYNLSPTSNNSAEVISTPTVKIFVSKSLWSTVRKRQNKVEISCFALRQIDIRKNQNWHPEDPVGYFKDMLSPKKNQELFTHLYHFF